jgi:hypothetical protein
MTKAPPAVERFSFQQREYHFTYPIPCDTPRPLQFSTLSLLFGPVFPKAEPPVVPLSTEMIASSPQKGCMKRQVSLILVPVKQSKFSPSPTNFYPNHPPPPHSSVL